MSDKLCCPCVYSFSSCLNMTGCISIYGSTLSNYSTFAKILFLCLFSITPCDIQHPTVIRHSSYSNSFSSQKTFVHLLFNNMLDVRQSSVRKRESLRKQCTLDQINLVDYAKWEYSMTDHYSSLPIDPSSCTTYAPPGTGSGLPSCLHDIFRINQVP